MKKRILRSMVFGTLGSMPVWLPMLIAEIQASSAPMNWQETLKDAGYATILFILIGFVLPKKWREESDAREVAETRHRQERETAEASHREERSKAEAFHREERTKLYELIADLKKVS